MSSRHLFFTFLFALGLRTDALLADPQLPDLICEIKNISQTTVDGQPAVRFGTWAVNLGAGALELRTVTQPNGTRDVSQRVYDTEGGYTETFLGNFNVGTDSYVKMPDAADYFLREVMEDDSVGATLSSNEKVGFCFVDSVKYPSASPPGTPPSGVYGWTIPSCQDVLGTSVGWVDNYGPNLPNQYLLLTNISSGTYWLENKLDPLNRLMESNDSNNSARIKYTVTTSYAADINLAGNSVSIANNDLSPGSADHTDFGYADVASGSVLRTFTVQNTGSGTVSLTGVPKVKINGSGDFTVVSQPASPVAAGASTTFQISFDPSGMNATAEVSIVNNDGDEAPYRFAIRGNANSGNADADGDGMPDEWEALYTLSNPAGDEDGDGRTNLEEFIAGNSPRDPQSVFRVTNAVKSGETCEVTWDSVSGRTYKLYSSADLGAPPPWNFLDQWAGTGAPITAVDGPLSTTPRFYRVTAEF